MTEYISSHVVDVVPAPEGEKGEDAGYYVTSGSGYVYWLPEREFNSQYRKLKPGSFTFAEALDLVIAGLRVAREGRNGKGMFIFLVPGSTFKVNRPPLLGIYPKDTSIDYHAHIDMRTADGTIVPWVVSQTDLLATDWHVVDVAYSDCKYFPDAN